MKIVIEIDNEHYERIMRLEEDVTVYPTTLALYEAVKDGKPLEAQPTDAEREAYIKGYDYGVKDWFKSKTQPTNAVSREQALLALTGMNLPTDRDKLIALFTERIQHLPPVTPQRPKGKWICVEGNPDEYHYECSECGQRLNWVDENDHYCCRCGSRNDEGL